MKFIICTVALFAYAAALPVADEKTVAKRGIVGLAHAPVIAPAPLAFHAAPAFTAVHAAPLIAHAPVIAKTAVLPAAPLIHAAPAFALSHPTISLGHHWW